MSDITGGVEPTASELNEATTGKYAVVLVTNTYAKVQRPDGTFLPEPALLIWQTEALVAELERARLDNSSDCFKTLQTVASQRDALQVLLDGERYTNATWADLMEAEREQANVLAKNLADTQYALEASEMMRQTLGEEVGRLQRELGPAEVVPTGYMINKDIGGWYFTEPNPASDTIRMRWSSMEEAQLDARNHMAKIEAGLKDPDTGRPWSLSPIDRNVLKHVREFLEGYPDHHPVAIKAERHSSGRLTLELEKVPQKMATWDNGQPMVMPEPIPAKPMSEMPWGQPRRTEPHLLWESTWKPAPCMIELPSEHADYIEAGADVVKPWPSPSRFRSAFWREGPFSAMVRARVDVACCGIIKGDVFEVTKDYGDGLCRLVGTPFKVGSPHFFDWDDVDAQLEMIEETTPKPEPAPPPGYIVEKVDRGFIYRRERTDEVGPRVWFPLRYASREEATTDAWKEAIIAGEVTINQQRRAFGLEVFDLDVDPRPAREPVPRISDHWVISRPPGRQLYRAALVTFDGDEFRSGDETMHAESLTIIRQKVLHWFRTRKQPAACVPRDPLDVEDIIETWL